VWTSSPKYTTSNACRRHGDRSYYVQCATSVFTQIGVYTLTPSTSGYVGICTFTVTANLMIMGPLIPLLVETLPR